VILGNVGQPAPKLQAMLRGSAESLLAFISFAVSHGHARRDQRGGDRSRRPPPSAPPSSSAMPTDPSRSRYPRVQVQLSGEDGNAFAILGRTAAALPQAGVGEEEIDAFFAEATSGDYDHLLQAP
jgi:hypothetical protein